MTEKECIFENLKQLADAIVALFGKNCEACVHDLSSLQHSLIYIRGNVTHRKAGAPATDLLVKMLKQNSNTPESLYNYKTTAADGRSLKSTTTFINDSAGKPFAAFCINFDTTDFYNASQTLMPFLNLQGNNSQPDIETFAHSIGETVEAMFTHGVEEVGKHPTTMNVEEKTQLISYLEDNGTFQLKGSVDQVAQMMGVTKFTVYNYLKKIRNSHQSTATEA
ncbi:MAG: helix-turn-helix transcriptional regulator [Desulforhopalus sp.]